MKDTTMNTEKVKDFVREKYGRAALRAMAGAGSACCGGTTALEACCDPSCCHSRP